MPKLSVVIPTYNRKNALKETLLSLNSQTSKDFEVVVADDGSNDGTAEMVKSLKLSYPISHVRQENAGRSAARNMGIEKAKGDIILFIDDHIIVDRRLVAEHISTHASYGREGVKVVRGRVEFIEQASDAPRETDYVDEKKFKHPSWEQEPFRAFITNNISVDKRALLSVFGFDEDFQEYGLQDAEMGYRLKEAGYRYKINPNAAGHIFGVGWTFEERLKRRRQVGRSSVLFYKKHPTLLNKINLSVHWMALAAQKMLSPFEARLPKKLQMTYNLTTGIKEGLEKYRDPKYSIMHSRFKGNKKSILFVSHISDLSGAPISLSLLAGNIDRDKYHPVVALPDAGPITAKLNALGVSYQLYKDSLLHSIFPSLKIARILKERQIDLVYLNTSASIWAAKSAKLKGIPIISHIREDLKGMNNLWIRSKISFCSDKIILISNWMKSFIVSDKAVVVHNTVNLEDFKELNPAKIRSELSLKKNVIGFIGSLEDRKGIKCLIKAFDILRGRTKDIDLVVVGKPLPGREGYLNSLKKLSKSGDVIFTGSRPDVYDIISACDIVAVPSISEAFGRVVIEAMACGKPVVTSNVGGIPEIVEDGRTGILVKPNDENAMANALGTLISDRKLAQTMGNAGRLRVERHFTLDGQIREIEKVIDETIKG